MRSAGHAPSPFMNCRQAPCNHWVKGIFCSASWQTNTFVIEKRCGQSQMETAPPPITPFLAKMAPLPNQSRLSHTLPFSTYLTCPMSMAKPNQKPLFESQSGRTTDLWVKYTRSGLSSHTKESKSAAKAESLNKSTLCQSFPSLQLKMLLKSTFS